MTLQEQLMAQIAKAAHDRERRFQFVLRCLQEETSDAWKAAKIVDVWDAEARALGI